MIYRRENPTTPSKRFRSVILNPVGVKIKNKFFYTQTQTQVGKHNGANVLLRKKKSKYKSKYNLYYSSYQTNLSIITAISIARRYKTFVGLIRYSNGAILCSPVFSGAYLNQLLKTWSYVKTSKIQIFSKFRTGSTVPVAYLPITSCFFNIMLSRNTPVFFCNSGGTFCIIIRFNLERDLCIIKIPSSKIIKIKESAYVTLGRNSNILIKGIWLGKAGVNVSMGYRPVVRGVAKNPVDHPHGGRTKSMSPERTPWGRVAKHNK